MRTKLVHISAPQFRELSFDTLADAHRALPGMGLHAVWSPGGRAGILHVSGFGSIESPMAPDTPMLNLAMLRERIL